MPKRIQLKRTKGWRMPANTVNVARPSKWGNPYKLGTCLIPDQAAAVAAFEANLPLTDFAALRGKNLACWCKPGTPCHADVLLRIANQ